MLIVAWLIGESFATATPSMLLRRPARAAGRCQRGCGAGVALVGLVCYPVAAPVQCGQPDQHRSQGGRGRPADVSIYSLLALVLVAMLSFGFRRGGEISTPYVQSLRLIVKNAVLWVMFLASMSASDFFSFDSHFNAFPRRTAQARGRNPHRQSDRRRRVRRPRGDPEARDRRSQRRCDTEGWKAYDKQLASLSQASQGAQGEIEKYFVQQMEARPVPSPSNRNASPRRRAGKAGLAGKKISIIRSCRG